MTEKGKTTRILIQKWLVKMLRMTSYLALVNAKSFKIRSQPVRDGRTDKKLVRNRTLPVRRPGKVAISNINEHQITNVNVEAKIGHRTNSRIVAIF